VNCIAACRAQPESGDKLPDAGDKVRQHTNCRWLFVRPVRHWLASPGTCGCHLLGRIIKNLQPFTTALTDSTSLVHWVNRASRVPCLREGLKPWVMHRSQPCLIQNKTVSSGSGWLLVPGAILDASQSTPRPPHTSTALVCLKISDSVWLLSCRMPARSLLRRLASRRTVHPCRVSASSTQLLLAAATGMGCEA
jgi:hypothetical protein